jgi:hypothetical protein
MLTEQERIKYQSLLEAAESAYHSLIIGGQAVDFTDQNGERIRYSAGNRGDLLNYINWLRSLLGLCPFALSRVARPAGVIF